MQRLLTYLMILTMMMGHTDGSGYRAGFVLWVTNLFLQVWVFGEESEPDLGQQASMLVQLLGIRAPSCDAGVTGVWGCGWVLILSLQTGALYHAAIDAVL